jgi:presenilin-like A22 family membrane protease
MCSAESNRFKLGVQHQTILQYILQSFLYTLSINNHRLVPIRLIPKAILLFINIYIYIYIYMIDNCSFFDVIGISNDTV